MDKHTLLISHARNLADLLKTACQAGEGFAVFQITSEGDFIYASSAERSGVKKMLVDWLGRFRQGGLPNDGAESPDSKAQRLALEARCKAAASHVRAPHKVLLFLFDLGTEGHVAYWTNLLDPRGTVQRWLDTENRTS